MNLIWVLDEKSRKALEDFLEALDKTGIKYEHNQERFMIKIKGYIVRSVPFIIPELKFEQNKSKRIHISKSSEGIKVRIFDKKKPMPIDLTLPIKWNIEFEKPYLVINY